jgi:hypothetical protein
MKFNIFITCLLLALFLKPAFASPSDLKEIINSLTSEIDYKKSQNDPSNLVITLVIKNSGERSIGVSLPRFPMGLVFSPNDLDPLSTDGVPEEKMADGKSVPMILAPHSSLKKEIAIAIPNELAGSSPSQTFKLMAFAWFVDKVNKPLNGKIKSFFLVGSVKNAP